jgi:uncharacterized protein
MNDFAAHHPLPPEAFDALDEILDDLRTRGDDVPQWEFCEGAMAALLCTRRPVATEESLPLLLGTGDSRPGQAGNDPQDTWFADEGQYQRFLALWTQRAREVATALDADVQTLEDERAFHPEVMDVRGALACLPEAERAQVPAPSIPSFAQVWALGFMFVVENWAEEWAEPRDHDAAGMLHDALDAIVALTEDDTGEPAVCMHREGGPPSVSEERLNAFGAAIWAVYDLRQLWQSLGPRVEPVRRAVSPGRNEPCPCGSGRKYKKCHGASGDGGPTAP